MKPFHILVVDDEPQIRNLLTEFLTRDCYRVTPVSSAIEEQEAVKADPPDLIITDLQLEDSDGLDLIERLRAELPNTPVILLTGVLFDPKVAREVLSKKVSSYLPKTSPLSQILSEVQRLLAG
jgi:CheY-like chemotaxis protein